VVFIKRIIALSLLMAMILGMCSCSESSNDSKVESSGKTSKSTTITTKPDIGEPPPLSYYFERSLRELESTEILGFTYLHLDPRESIDDEPNPALDLFERTYDGKVSYYMTTYEEKYDDLAAVILAGREPDFISINDMDLFPECAIKDMIIPIDDYFDLESPLWEDTKETADKFIFQGKRYVSIVRNEPSYVMVYNKNTIQENGLDDPVELFDNGEWNWDTFADMCIEFTNPAKDKYALGGWYYEHALMQSSGMPLIELKDGEIYNNIYSETYAEVNDFMYNLQKNGICCPKHENNENIRDGIEGSGIGSGLTLFYPIGLWTLEQPPSVTEVYGDVSAGEVMFVPVPCNPESDVTYVPSKPYGFCFVKGGKNPEGVAAFLDCARYCELDGATEKITLRQYKDLYGWTDEMFYMRTAICELASENPVFDFSTGVTDDITSVADEVIRGTMNVQEQQTWTSIVEENGGKLDYWIDEVMDSMVW